MKDLGHDAADEAEGILHKIVADFEQLDRAIDAAILRLKEGDGGPGDIEALQRALEAVRKGAKLARGKLTSE